MLPASKGAFLVWNGNNTLFDAILQHLTIKIGALGKLAFFVYDNIGYAMIHCCKINHEFEESSKGAFNSINEIKSESNVTFW